MEIELHDALCAWENHDLCAHHPNVWRRLLRREAYDISLSVYRRSRVLERGGQPLFHLAERRRPAALLMTYFDVRRRKKWPAHQANTRIDGWRQGQQKDMRRLDYASESQDPISVNRTRGDPQNGSKGPSMLARTSSGPLSCPAGFRRTFPAARVLPEMMAHSWHGCCGASALALRHLLCGYARGFRARRRVCAVTVPSPTGAESNAAGCVEAVFRPPSEPGFGVGTMPGLSPARTCRRHP